MTILQSLRIFNLAFSLFWHFFYCFYYCSVLLCLMTYHLSPVTCGLTPMPCDVIFCHIRVK